MKQAYDIGEGTDPDIPWKDSEAYKRDYLPVGN